jgi:UDP-N-acetylbacillosamine N-acetyltransferase
MKRKVVLWGASGHAMVIADAIRLQGTYEIVGFLDDVNKHRRGQLFCGSTVLGGEEQLDVLRSQGVDLIFMAFGNCRARLDLSRKAREKGFMLATVLHPTAIIASDVQVRVGSAVLAGAIINPGSSIGENVIVNTAASVDHECILENGVHISPGVHLAGNVRVGEATWIGIGASVIDRVRIGSGSIIGAGAVVLNDIPDRSLVVGIPAKVIKNL